MFRMVIAVLGGIADAFASALSCAGPLIAVSLGVSGAGLASAFEALRPYFLAGTGLFLGSGFDSATAVVHYDAERSSPPQFIAALKKLTGYDAVVVRESPGR